MSGGQHICDDCYVLLGRPAVVACVPKAPCFFCGGDQPENDEWGAKLYHDPIHAIRPICEELERFRNGYKGSCYACEPCGIKNLELRNALIEIMLKSVQNGEDCSYLLAKNALDADSFSVTEGRTHD